MNRAAGAPLFTAFVAVATTCVGIAIYTQYNSRLLEHRTVGCANHLKGIGLAIAQYAQDYDDTLPRAWCGKDAGPSNATNSKWMDALGPYVLDYGIYNCPNDEVSKPYKTQSGTNYGSYVFNNAYSAFGAHFTSPSGQKLSGIENTTAAVVIDGQDDFQFTWPDARHEPPLPVHPPWRMGPITGRHDTVASGFPMTLWVDGSVHNYSLQQIAAEKTIHGQKVYTGFTIERD